MSEIASGAEARVGGDFFGIGAKRSACRGEQRPEAARVGRAGLHALRDNDLMRTVDGNLGVVACDDAALGRLNTAVGIGEVALGAIRRPAVSAALRPAVRSIMPEEGPGPSSPSRRRSLLLRPPSAALAARMRSSRAALLADPVRHLVAAPLAAVLASSAASVASAWASQADTSAASFFSVSACAHRTSPCARWHWPASWCRPAPHARASPAPPPGTA